MEKAKLIILAVSFIWVGFMSAISFMESWLKFKSPELEVPIGLAVGRRVFKALNRVEWVFLIIIWLSYFISGMTISMSVMGVYILLAILLVLQGFWLLPIMSIRVTARLKGEDMPPSHLHSWYVGMEFIKLLLLIFTGSWLLQIL